MDIKHIKYLLDIFEEAVEKRSQVYEIADDEDDENHAAAECGAAKAELIRARTGLDLDPTFTAAKLKWVLRNRPGIGAGRLVGRLPGRNNGHFR